VLSTDERIDNTVEIRKQQRAGVAKAEIARRLEVSRTSVRRILGDSSTK
jgi:DNA invertase Pin-like site-specific DNA recombinase